MLIKLARFVNCCSIFPAKGAAKHVPKSYAHQSCGTTIAATNRVDSKVCKSILVVEDEDLIRENLKALLEFEGYIVYTASNGKEGLRLLGTMARPCLILLDLLMPVMNGMEFLEAKNQNDAIACIPVCIVSGVAEKPESVAASAFIKKPMDFDLLLKFVRQYCGKSDHIKPEAEISEE